MKKLLLAFPILLVTAFAPRSSSASVSIGVLVSEPAGFGGYLSLWPNEALSIDGFLTHRLFDIGATGHIQLGAGPAHRLLVAGTVGRIHTAGDDLIVGTKLGAGVGYGYQNGWDLRLLAGFGGYEGVSWTYGPTFTAMFGWTF
jgi:hypothetical protein